ncbi:MAG: hypothetical protein QM658_13730 [Gordonia sp. (in: high G+C Gram-positive bacteria)]
MAFFRRRDVGPNALGPENPAAPRDPVFSDFAAHDADWIRATARRILAENGVEATLDSDGATFVAADGYRLTLDNAVHSCLHAPRD